MASDLELIEEFRKGRVECFNELVGRYQHKVYWIARRIVGSHEDADDVVQDVFVRVYKALANFRSESGFYTWLYRIAMNVSLNAVRAKRVKDFIRFDELAGDEPQGDVAADAELLNREYEKILERAIDRLPARQKMVFMMRYYDEMPYEEMAKILNRAVGGLKANYFFALKKIQKYVRREMGS